MKSLQQAVINQMKKGILVFVGGRGGKVGMLFISPFSTTARFSKFDIRNVILFQIKVFGKSIKETTVVRYFIKVTVRLSFALLLRH